MPGSHAAHGSGGDTRALDLLNVILCLSPVGALVLPLGFASGRTWWRRPETVFLASLVVPLAIVALVFYPPEGLFRFWDIVAPLGVALSLIGAWSAGGIIESAPRWRWLAVTLTCATACSALQWLVRDADTGRGLTRVRAFLNEPPARAPELRATVYEFLGFRLIDLGRPAEAAEAFAHAAEVIPSPRVLRQWEIAETMAGNPVAAQSVLRLIVERDPENRMAWRQLAARSAQLGDTAEVARSLRALMRLDPGDRGAREALRRIETARPATDP